MAVTIDKVFVKTFEGNLRHLAQQQDTYLRRWVQEKNGLTTSSHSFPRMGQLSLSAKSGRAGVAAPNGPGGNGRVVPTPYQDPVFSNRVAIAAKYDGGTATEKEDQVKTLIDPNSAIAHSLALACKRQIDDIIIAAADGGALDEAGVSNALPAAQKIGTGVAEFGFATITEVNQKFLEKEIDPSTPKVFVIGPTQARLLLHEAKATSSDFVGQTNALVNGGFVKNFMGFDFVVSNRLLSSGAGKRTCLAFTRDAIGLLVLEDIYSEIAKDPSISFAYRIYAALNMGAVRVEDEQLLAIDVKDTATIA